MGLARQKFGIDAIDEALGGGLLPGTLTVIAGATGAGKTQLGLRWANQGLEAEGRRGVLCDLTSRGDSQNHAAYAKSHFDWDLTQFPATEAATHHSQAWDFSKTMGDYFHPMARSGRRVTRTDLDPDQWHEWKLSLIHI